jgi:hypothetical protein
MTTSIAPKFNPELLDYFGDSTLALYLEGHEDAVFAQGTVQFLAPGADLKNEGQLPLHVVLDGRLAGDEDWFGPGNHFESRGAALRAMDLPARVWTLDLGAGTWRSPANAELRRAMTHALIAADAAEAAATPPAILPDPETLCDADHPDIRRRAARLRRATPASTAEAILKYVHSIPYRFGIWQERASDTLARGVGMCTTKANLQVALLRAAGLEAGFVEIPVQTAFLGKLMPDAWLALQRPTVRHYFAAVKLNGVWHGCDSSYDYGSYRIFLEQFPWMAPSEEPALREGHPYIPSMELLNLNLFDIQVTDSITTEMGKKSRFKPRHFEALNTRLDRARGTHLHWGRAARQEDGDEAGVGA